MEVIKVKEAREYIQASYPNDPLLKHIVIAALEQLPKVDAVEVVHCTDCENWQAPWLADQTLGVCQVGRRTLTEPNHFCSYGERKYNA